MNSEMTESLCVVTVTKGLSYLLCCIFKFAERLLVCAPFCKKSVWRLSGNEQSVRTGAESTFLREYFNLKCFTDCVYMYTFLLNYLVLVSTENLFYNKCNLFCIFNVQSPHSSLMYVYCRPIYIQINI